MKSSTAMHRSRSVTSGLTLVELILALGIFSLLLVAVFQLIDRSLSMWRRADTRRTSLEMSSTVIDMLAADLRGLEPGPRGDLIVEWVRFDTDGDGAADVKWPRISCVRQASAADVERVIALDDAQNGLAKTGGGDEGAVDVQRAQPALVEVLWLVVPASFTNKDARTEGILWRGARRVGDPATKSFFAPDFFGASNRAPAGATEPVTSGVLWMDVRLASQTSIVYDGWDVSAGPESVATSWDAWTRGRPDVHAHPFNEPAPGLPKARERALLPRRVRFEFEFERAIDRERRTWLAQPLDTNEVELVVDDGERVPRGADTFLLVDFEWMQVVSVDGNRVQVKRAQRGTQASLHGAKAMLHHGGRLAREITIATYREDWDLR